MGEDIVSVEEKGSPDAKKNINVILSKESAEICFNIAREEYNHTFDRSDKLDNKVYIALTFCAFIFVFVMGLLSAITEFAIPNAMTQFVLVVLYIVGCVILIGSFLYVLVKLAKLLKPMEATTINSNFLMINNVQKQSEYTIYTFASAKYTYATNENNTKLENRFKEYSKCISTIVWIVILTFVLQIIKMLIG